MITGYMQEARQRFHEFGGFWQMDPDRLPGSVSMWADSLWVRAEPGLTTLMALVPAAQDGALRSVRDGMASVAQAIREAERTEVQGILLIVTDRPLTRPEYDRWQELKLHAGPVRVVPWIVDLPRGRVFQHDGMPFGIDPDLAVLAVPEPSHDEEPRAVQPGQGRSTAPDRPQAAPGAPDRPQATPGAPGRRQATPGAPGRRQATPAEPQPWATIALLTIIIGIGVAMTIMSGSLELTPESTALLERWGAAVRPDMWLRNEPWRLFTAVFIHIGLIHLIMNSLSLWWVGRPVELLYGPLRMLYVFLVAGVAGSAASAALGPPVVLSAGASGAIFGLLGAVIWYRLSSPLGERIAWRPLLMTLGLNLGLGLALSNIVDNWNHIGGLAGGLLAAAVIGVPAVAGMRRPRFHLPRPVRAVLAGVLLLAAAAVVAGKVELPGPGRDLADGVRLIEAGLPRQAEVPLRRAVERQPDEPYPRAVLIHTYALSGRCEQAASELSQLIAAVPDLHPEARQNLEQNVRACGSKQP